MANEEKMNVDIENQENLEKKKKIIVICLSVALILVTLIAGFFIVKKNKKDSHENSDIEEVVNENTKDGNNNVDDKTNKNGNNKDNEAVIAGEDNYFFNRASGQVTMNILLFLVTGIILFLWENDKLNKREPSTWCGIGLLSCTTRPNAYCDAEKKEKKSAGEGIFAKENWFCLGTFVSIITFTLLVEFILHFLIGSIAHLFSKDKNKRYFHTLKMSWKKRKQILSSFSKTKIFFITLCYIICGFIIAIIARIMCNIDPCCCKASGRIIDGHGQNYCLCFCPAKYGEEVSL